MIQCPLSEQGILPLQAWETREIRIGGVDDESSLDGEGGEMGIGREVSRAAEIQQLGGPGLEMGLRRVNDLHVGKRKPLLDPRQGIHHREGILEDFRMCGETHEALNHHPGQGDTLSWPWRQRSHQASAFECCGTLWLWAWTRRLTSGRIIVRNLSEVVLHFEFVQQLIQAAQVQACRSGSEIMRPDRHRGWVNQWNLHSAS